MTIVAALTWPELHAALSVDGAHYEAKGSGAVVTRRGEPTLKASFIGAECSRSALVRRLGPFVCSSLAPALNPDLLQVLVEIDARLTCAAKDYATATRLLGAQCDATVANDQRLGQSAYAGIIAEAITAEFKRALKAVLAFFRSEKIRLRTLRRNARAATDIDASSLSPVVFLSGQSEFPAAEFAVAGYFARPVTGGVAYYRQDGALGFTDHRTYLFAPASAIENDLVTAMRCAESRFGAITLIGSPVGCSKAAALARSHGIDHVPVLPRDRDPAIQPVSPPGTDADVEKEPQVDFHGWFAIADEQLEALRTAVRAAPIPQGRNVNYRPRLKILELVTESRALEHIVELVRCLAPFLTQEARLEAASLIARERVAVEANARLSAAAAARSRSARYAGVRKAKRVAAKRAAQRAAASRPAAKIINDQRSAAQISMQPFPVVPTGQDDVRHRKRAQSMER